MGCQWSPVVGTSRAALEADDCHEAALSVPPAWLIRENGRTGFAAEFVAKKQRADAAGISLSTLAIDDELPSEQLELLVRRGITAIRTERPPAIRLARRDGSSGSGIAPIRYGLWRVACEMRYRGGGWLAERLAAERICSEIDRRIAASSASHLVIDCAGHSLADKRQVERIREHLTAHPTRATLEPSRWHNRRNGRPLDGAEVEPVGAIHSSRGLGCRRS